MLSQASESTAQIITGVTVTIHAYYSTGHSSQGGDIAVVRLPRALTFNTYVQPVCIPSTPVADGTNCVVTGWGSTQSRPIRYTEFSIFGQNCTETLFLIVIRVYCSDY